MIKYNTNDNPLIYISMIFMFSHLLYGVRLYLAFFFPEILDNVFFGDYLIKPDNFSIGFYKYVLKTFLYFIFFYLGFSLFNYKTNKKYYYYLNLKRNFFFGIIIIISSIYIYILNNLNIYIPSIIIYVITNIQRYLMPFWYIISLFVISKKFQNKITSIIMLIISILAGILSFYFLNQRYMLFMLFFIFFIVYIKQSKINFKKILNLVFIFLLIFIIFGITTSIKFSVPTESIMDLNFLENTYGSIINRLANAQAEIYMTLDEGYIFLLKNNQNQIIYDILGALPFFGTLFEPLNSGPATIDMQVNWLHAGERVNSSINVPLVTSLEYGFNFLVFIIFILLTGLFHGALIRYINEKNIEYSWIFSYALITPIAVSGITRGMVFGLLTNFIFYLILIKFLYNKRSKSK
jgi:hypothetical protein